MIIFNWIIHMCLGLLFAMPVAHTRIDLLFSVFGALLPDIDHPSSLLGRLNPLAQFMSHRAFTHTIVGCILLSLPFLLVNNSATFFVFIGSMSHLLGDKLCSLLWGKNFKLRVWW